MFDLIAIFFFSYIYSFYQEGKTENAAVLTAIKECLQVIFSCTLDMGSLAKGTQMNYEEYAFLHFL